MAMAVTLDDLYTVLQAEDLRPFTDGDDTLILLVPDNGRTIILLIRIAEDGELVLWFMPEFLHLPKGRGRSAVMLKLLELNSYLKTLKFGVRPVTNVVSAEVALPIEDSVLTLQQVHRMLYTFYHVAIEERDRLRQLIETGVYPEDEQEAIDESVMRLFESSAEIEPVPGADRDDAAD
jgi:hypothetical protein